MTAIAINPLVVAVSPDTAATPIHHFAPTEFKGGGFKKFVGVVAAIAIPIAAPLIAGSIAASGVLGAGISAAMATTVGGVVSSAIVGAGLGAISAKVTGGDVKTGAIMGALTSGFSGYRAMSTQGRLGTLGETFGSSGAEMTGDQVGVDMGQGGSGTELLDGTDDALLEANSGQTFTGGPTTDGQIVQASYDPAASSVEVGAGTGGQEAAGKTFWQTVKDTGSSIVDKVTDPDKLADLTMQAGAQLVGAALAPDPEMPPEQKELLEMRKQELAELKARDEKAFNAQMDAAKMYLQQARQYDPNYFALQAANTGAIEQQRKIREQARRAGLTRRGISAADQRRMQLAAAKDVSSRYDTGFRQGLALQDRALASGRGALQAASSSGTAYSNALANLSSAYGDAMNKAYTRSDTAAKNISDMFSGMATSKGNTPEEEEELKKASGQKKPNAGLNTGSIAGNAPIMT